MSQTSSSSFSLVSFQPASESPGELDRSIDPHILPILQPWSPWIQFPYISKNIDWPLLWKSKIWNCQGNTGATLLIKLWLFKIWNGSAGHDTYVTSPPTSNRVLSPDEYLWLKDLLHIACFMFPLLRSIQGMSKQKMTRQKSFSTQFSHPGV